MTTVTELLRNAVDCEEARTYRGNDQCLLIAKLGWAIFPAEVNPEQCPRKQTNLNH